MKVGWRKRSEEQGMRIYVHTLARISGVMELGFGEVD